MAPTASQQYFAEYAERLLDQGYHPLPVQPKGKRTFIPKWQRWCDHPPSPATVESFVARKPDHSVGLACGRSIIAIDIDIEDQGQAVQVEHQAKKMLGDTPLLRIGKEPKRALIYKPAQAIKSSSWATAHGHRIDLLGNGRQVVAFGHHAGAGHDYLWPDESPLDVHRDQLPGITAEQCAELRRATACPGGSPAGTPIRSTMLETTAGRDGAGQRNNMLFRLCKDTAHQFDTVEDLEAFAVEINRSTFDLPLPEAEALKCARSVWRYKMDGRLIHPGQQFAVIRSEDRQALRGEPAAMMLLVYIREHHPPHHEFCVSG